MESPGAAGRRRGNSRSNVEDQALDQIAKEVSSALNHLISTTNISAYIIFIYNTILNKI